MSRSRTPPPKHSPGRAHISTVPTMRNRTAAHTHAASYACIPALARCQIKALQPPVEGPMPVRPWRSREQMMDPCAGGLLPLAPPQHTGVRDTGPKDRNPQRHAQSGGGSQQPGGRPAPVAPAVPTPAAATAAAASSLPPAALQHARRQPGGRHARQGIRCAPPHTVIPVRPRHCACYPHAATSSLHDRHARNHSTFRLRAHMR